MSVSICRGLATALAAVLAAVQRRGPSQEPIGFLVCPASVQRKSYIRMVTFADVTRVGLVIMQRQLLKDVDPKLPGRSRDVLY